MAWLRILIALLCMVALGDEALAQRQWRQRPVSEAERQAAEVALARFTSPILTRFASDEEFRDYLAAVTQYRRTRGEYYYDYSSLAGLQFAQAATPAASQSDTTEPICPDGDMSCLPAAERSIVVTGSRIASPSNPSITNNQMQGVEEGDIVKQIGHFLLVLQDGRIFVIDTRAGGRRLALTDRMNVYRNPSEDMWYDEMLVFGNQVLITGYSYREDASELSVFRLDQSGRLHREGVFYISSDDYYDTSNYATRLIDNNLIIYTPYSISSMGGRRARWPVVRRWVDGQSREQMIETGRRLFDANAIYRPVRQSSEPVVHSVSICPLGSAAQAGNLQCRTTAFVGSAQVEWYVTRDAAYVWTSEGRDWRTRRECRPGERFAPGDVVPASIYRVSTADGVIGIAGARGQPFDQFSMQASDTRLYALLNAQQNVCQEDWDAPVRLSYFQLPLADFSDRLSAVPEQAYTGLPSVGSRWVVNRFTSRYLVYGSLSRYRRGLPQYDEPCRADDENCRAHRRAARAMPPAYVVPIDRPAEVRPLAVGHTVIRAEQAGNDIVLTGYRDAGGLRVTLIDLDRRPRIAGSVLLAGRFESEGRSHAFNSLIEGDGSGLMGVPTVPRIADGDRAPWRSRASDLSFIEVTPAGELGHAGELRRRFDYSDDSDSGVPGYTCEVSCIDWYGNSRPIFTDGRIFALTGTELIEGRMAAGEIREVQRLNIALGASPSR